MTGDIVAELGYLFLGTRLKRLGERMQADVARLVEREGFPIQPSQYPILAALDRYGPLTVGEMVQAMGLSQPAVTRNLARLIEIGLVEASRIHKDQRHKTMTLTDAGCEAVARSRQYVWPQIEAVAYALAADLSGPIASQLGALEKALAQTPLDRRVEAGPMRGLRVLPWADERAKAFHEINAEWISAMFRLEQTDLDVLENPRAKVIEPGGDILFVEAQGLGIVGTVALQKTGEGLFELTKMGVTEAARGRKAGEFLLHAALRRAGELNATTLYLLTNTLCAPAIHLYEKLGFVHDAGIMHDYGARYERCDVAMLYAPGR